MNTNSLKEAVERTFDLNLWPQKFIYGCALIAASNRLNIDAVLLALIAGTAIFIGIVIFIFVNYSSLCYLRVIVSHPALFTFLRVGGEMAVTFD